MSKRLHCRILWVTVCSSLRRSPKLVIVIRLIVHRNNLASTAIQGSTDLFPKTTSPWHPCLIPFLPSFLPLRPPTCPPRSHDCIYLGMLGDPVTKKSQASVGIQKSWCSRLGQRDNTEAAKCSRSNNSGWRLLWIILCLKLQSFLNYILFSLYGPLLRVVGK